MFRDQADLTAAADHSDWAERGRWVVDRLHETADRTQRALRTELESQGSRVTSFRK